MITIVSSDMCPFCMRAKQLISDLGFKYEEIKVTMWSPELREIIQKSGLMSVPQIFAWEISQDNLLWGFDDINALHNEGKLVDIFKKVS